MSFRLLALAATAALFATSAGAQTRHYLFTYSGTLTYGHDNTGEFGAPGADLAGEAFKVVYTLTYPTPGAFDEVTALTHYTYGGSGFGLPSPVSAKLTIKGATFSFAGSTGSSAQLLNYGILPGRSSYLRNEVRDVEGSVGPGLPAIYNTIDTSVRMDEFPLKGP